MQYLITSATQKIANLKKRIKVIQGGTSAGKTIGTLEVLIDKCQKDNPGDITSVISESFPHLRRGAERDFLSIMEGHNYFNDSRWNKTDHIYTFETGAKMEFFSADQPSKVRGPRRKRAFLNEADKIPKETFDQIEVRTIEEIYIDYNPVAEFWAQELTRTRDDVDFLILTYKDNEGLQPEIIKAIEQRRGNKGWWRVYGEGLLGEIEGKIYKNWQLLDELPKEARLERRYLDYGYTNDPTASGGIYRWNDSWVIDEEIYQSGLLNNQIGDLILNQPVQVPVAADSAEPKSNDELSLRGITIIPARKGKDSVNNGIQIVQQQKIFVTKRSTNVWKEYLAYLWMVDNDGKTLNVPIPTFNHHMDGIRYGFESLLNFTPPAVVRSQNNHFDSVRARMGQNSAK